MKGWYITSLILTGLLIFFTLFSLFSDGTVLESPALIIPSVILILSPIMGILNYRKDEFKKTRNWFVFTGILTILLLPMGILYILSGVKIYQLNKEKYHKSVTYYKKIALEFIAEKKYSEAICNLKEALLIPDKEEMPVLIKYLKNIYTDLKNNNAITSLDKISGLYKDYEGIRENYNLLDTKGKKECEQIENELFDKINLLPTN